MEDNLFIDLKGSYTVQRNFNCSNPWSIGRYDAAMFRTGR